MKSDSVAAAIDALVATRNHDPFALLGLHAARVVMERSARLRLINMHPSSW